jgi:hypothetical protein
MCLRLRVGAMSTLAWCYYMSPPVCWSYVCAFVMMLCLRLWVGAMSTFSWRCYVSACVLELCLRFHDDVMSPPVYWSYVYDFVMMLCLRLWVVSLCRFTSGERALCTHWIEPSVDPRAGLKRGANILDPTGTQTPDPSVVQAVGRNFTDWATADNSRKCARSR